jgi:hypothetical protein
MNMLLIHTPDITNRLQYIVDLILGELLGLEFRLTTSWNELTAYEGPKLAYTREQDVTVPFIAAQGLLFEHALHPRESIVSSHEEIPVLFPIPAKNALLPFDIFAASFYMVSRYEEYHIEETDRYGRFPASQSCAYKHGFLDKPVVHYWTHQLGKALCRLFPSLSLKKPSYRFIPTIDIDHAYAYLHRPIQRTLGAIARSVIHGEFKDIAHRIQVLTRMANDPFDVYGYLTGLHDQYGLSPQYFILFADYGGNDNNIPIRNKTFHELIRSLDRGGTVGIHPSLSSGKHFRRLEREYKKLSKVLHRKITISRQHFLKISMPRTYRTLMRLGIREDYSMGFASHIGFRAGIAHPFIFFDLLKNDRTPLRIYPIMIMDVTMRDYLRLNPSQSLELIDSMIRTVKSVQGSFISLWHNESLSGYGHWKGWREVYEQMLRMASV